MKHKFCFNPRKRWCDCNGLYCPGPGDIVSHYTQITLNGLCDIPEPKPDCEKLINEHCSVKIKNVKVVDVAEYETGHRYLGKKILVNGIFRLGIEYSAKNPAQTVHYFHCDIPFNTIILSCCNGQEHLFPHNFCLDDYVVHICVEYLHVERTSKRSFKKAIVIMVWMQQKAPLIPDESKDCDDGGDDDDELY